MRQKGPGGTRLSRLVIISNRVALAEKGKQAGGGLVTGVLDALREIGGIWFGWSGETAGTGSATAQGYQGRWVDIRHGQFRP
jgi:trehalose 6-phosphate synthase